jgi:hypothetical protein
MDEIRRILHDFNQRLEKFEKGIVIKILTIPPDSSGAFIPKVVSTDPLSPKTNEIWINSTSHQLKWWDGTTLRAVTLS